MIQGGYGSQQEYLAWVQEDAAKRREAIAAELRAAFGSYIEWRQVEVVAFSDITVPELARALRAHPSILKPLLIACNVAARAIERDLDIKGLDTYAPSLTDQEADRLAGYLKPFLPPYLELPALVELDRVEFIDKEIRAAKGRWERAILDALNRLGPYPFKKRKFQVEGEKFEIDAASPPRGEIEIGVDIKRVEARRDIHKRCDEIVNKAVNLKRAFPRARFGVVIYYPFPAEHSNVEKRLRSGEVDQVVFASQSRESIETAVRLLLSGLGVGK